MLLEMGARCLPRHAGEIVIDLDAMGHRLHGLQEGRHFNAYYDDYVYLPLDAFVGNLPFWAQLRTADHGVAHGVVAALEQIVAALRRRCKTARIIVRGDSGFCVDELLSWCEANDVYYCLGLGNHSVLIEKSQSARADARARHWLTGSTPRAVCEFDYETRSGSWSRARRVLAKGEVQRAGRQPALHRDQSSSLRFSR